LSLEYSFAGRSSAEKVLNLHLFWFPVLPCLSALRRSFSPSRRRAHMASDQMVFHDSSAAFA